MLNYYEILIQNYENKIKKLKEAQEKIVEFDIPTIVPTSKLVKKKTKKKAISIVEEQKKSENTSPIIEKSE